jgi:hypothetical protein
VIIVAWGEGTEGVILKYYIMIIAGLDGSQLLLTAGMVK